MTSLEELVEWTTHVHASANNRSFTCDVSADVSYPSLLIVDDFDKYLPLGQVSQLLNVTAEW